MLRQFCAILFAVPAVVAIASPSLASIPKNSTVNACDDKVCIAAVFNGKKWDAWVVGDSNGRPYVNWKGFDPKGVTVNTGRSQLYADRAYGTTSVSMVPDSSPVRVSVTLKAKSVATKFDPEPNDPPSRTGGSGTRYELVTKCPVEPAPGCFCNGPVISCQDFVTTWYSSPTIPLYLSQIVPPPGSPAPRTTVGGGGVALRFLAGVM